MVMIRCPECGQHVLDVASSCPKCGHVLIQNPMETHGWGMLRTCGRCGKHIERTLAICPYCGHHVRAARLAGRVALGVAGAVVVAAAGWGLWRAGLLGPEGQRASAPAGPVAEAAAKPEPFPPLPRPDTPRAEPIVATAPGASGARDTTRPPAPPVIQAPTATLPGPRDLVRRWTREWANVRAARSMESTVVRVLPPGQAVDVREMRQGWWALHAGGTVVGYIANSLLTTNPPG
jgi:rRNA maturation protein Nop10